MGGFDRIKRDPPALHSPPRVAHAHMNDSHGGSSDLGSTSSKLDSVQKARRDSTIRGGKFLQPVTSRTDTKRVVVIVLSAIVPTFFYASASHAQEDGDAAQAPGAGARHP